MPLVEAAEPSPAIGSEGGTRHYLLRFASEGRARRIAAWCEAGLDATGVPFFPLLVLLPRAVVPLVSVAALCAAGLVLSTGGPKPRPSVALTAALFGTLVVWGAFSGLWSLDPARSLIIAARLAALTVIGLLLVAAACRLRAPERLNLLLLTGLALGVAAAAADLLTRGAVGAPFTDRIYQAAALNRASVSFAITLLPAGAVLLCRGQRLLGLAIGATTAIVIGALAGTAAKSALLAALPAGLLVYLSRTRFARAAAVVSVLVILTAPLTFAKLAQLPLLPHAADAVKLSGGHRLLIWSFAGDRIAERPLSGWGLDASRAMPGGSDLIRHGQTWLPLHPHNAPLQLWLELGVPGAVVFALLVALAWLALAEIDWPRLFAAAAGASLMVALVASFASYGIWEEWWLSVLWFLLYAILVMGRVARSIPATTRAARHNPVSQQKYRHPDQDYDDCREGISDKAGEADPGLSMPFELGIDRRHSTAFR
jgi:exopolysaccharide production protein ExoQ